MHIKYHGYIIVENIAEQREMASRCQVEESLDAASYSSDDKESNDLICGPKNTVKVTCDSAAESVPERIKDLQSPQMADIRQIFYSDDEDDSDLPGDSKITLDKLDQSMAVAEYVTVGTEPIGGVTTNDINSVDSLPDLEIAVKKPIVGAAGVKEGLEESSMNKDGEAKQEEGESGCQDFFHSINRCAHQGRWKSCRVSIHPVHSLSWYNPGINPAWLHTELRKNMKRRIEEGALETAEVIVDLKKKLEDQAGTIAEMKELNVDLRENLDQKEEAISELQELSTDLRENRDGLSLKIEEDREKHSEELKQMELDREKQNEELKQMKQKMEADQDKHTKELQNMSAKVHFFLLQPDTMKL